MVDLVTQSLCQTGFRGAIREAALAPRPYKRRRNAIKLGWRPVIPPRIPAPIGRDGQKIVSLSGRRTRASSPHAPSRHPSCRNGRGRDQSRRGVVCGRASNQSITATERSDFSPHLHCDQRTVSSCRDDAARCSGRTSASTNIALALLARSYATPCFMQILSRVAMIAFFLDEM